MRRQGPRAKAQIKVIDQEIDLQQARASRKVNPPTKTEINKALRSYRKLIRAEAPRANLALKALVGKVEMHPKGTGRAVSYVARCNIKLGEILLPSVSTYGSGDPHPPALKLDAALALNLDLEEASGPMDAGLLISEGWGAGEPLAVAC